MPLEALRHQDVLRTCMAEALVYVGVPSRKLYPTDISDEEWPFVGPYLTLIRLDTSQRCRDPRRVFDELRRVVRTGSPCRTPLNRIGGRARPGRAAEILHLVRTYDLPCRRTSSMNCA